MFAFPLVLRYAIPVMDRRTFLALAVSPLLPLPKRSGFRVGDWVRMVALPSYTAAWGASWNRDLQRHARVLQRCFGRRYPVVYVGDDGRAELDVSRDVEGFSISLEPECVVRLWAFRPEGLRNDAVQGRVTR
jgi:hypothetical protein